MLERPAEVRARKEADLPVFVRSVVEVHQNVNVPVVGVRVERPVLMEREGLASLRRFDVHGRVVKLDGVAEQASEHPRELGVASRPRPGRRVVPQVVQ